MHIKSFVGGIGVAGVAAALLFVAQCGQSNRVPTAPTSCNCSGAQTTTLGASDAVPPPAVVAVHSAARTPHATRPRGVHVAVHVTATAPAPEAVAPPLADIALTAPVDPAAIAPPVAEQPAPVAPVAAVEPVSPPVVVEQPAPESMLSMLASAAPMSLSLGVNGPQRRVASAPVLTATPVANARGATARR